MEKETKTIRAIGGGIILTTGAAMTAVCLIDWAAKGNWSTGLFVGAIAYGIATLAVWYGFDKIVRSWQE